MAELMTEGDDRKKLLREFKANLIGHQEPEFKLRFENDVKLTESLVGEGLETFIKTLLKHQAEHREAFRAAVGSVPAFLDDVIEAKQERS